ncbi:MAG: hypothetical protein FVQ78_06640 [Solirubrobacterales bacterium]|nr:hypothetical protein [Solirubrobacterales bacterium]
MSEEEVLPGLEEITPQPSRKALQAPFGSVSRGELLDHYFSDRLIDAPHAWQDVYRLLLWIDPTTGLAHCYESDKSQPGRHWYPRSLAFHAWAADEMGLAHRELGENIDWLFRRVLERLALSEHKHMDRKAHEASSQRAAYGDMPDPYEDPELRLLLERSLGAAGEEGPLDLMALVREIRRYVATENKRKNLLGEGFEDVLAAILSRLNGGPPPVVETQRLIQQIEGFREPRKGEKKAKVDLWLKTPSGRRVLVTAKWSVRADREKQLADDYRIYADCNDSPDTFDYVFVTNEFDAARLVAACDRMEMNRPIFDTVVHVSPGALLAAHGFNSPAPDPGEENEGAGGDQKQRRSAARLPGLVAEGRLISLEDWLGRVTAKP